MKIDVAKAHAKVDKVGDAVPDTFVKRLAHTSLLPIISKVPSVGARALARAPPSHNSVNQYTVSG